MLENEREIKTLEGLCAQFCCLTECKNCPVHLHGYEKRTEYEKCNLHEPCVSNLYKWVTEEVLKMNIKISVLRGRVMKIREFIFVPEDRDNPIKVVYEDDNGLVEVDNCTLAYSRRLSSIESENILRMYLE